MSNKKSYIIGGLVSFLILIGIAIVFFGNIAKPKMLLNIPETVDMAMVTKDGNGQEIVGDELQKLRNQFVNLGVREFKSEILDVNEGTLFQFSENGTECAKFRIIDKETLWDFVKYEKTGLIIVYKTDADLLELISKY